MTAQTPTQRDIKQTKPFESPQHEAVVALLRTADVVRRRVATALSPAGLTPQQYNILRILRGAGPAGLPTLEIAERLIEQAPGITRLCDTLRAKGFVTRTRSGADRRVVTCRISEAGLAILARTDPMIARADREVFGETTQDELRTLIGLLDRVRGEST